MAKQPFHSDMNFWVEVGEKAVEVLAIAAKWDER